MLCYLIAYVEQQNSNQFKKLVANGFNVIENVSLCGLPKSNKIYMKN